MTDVAVSRLSEEELTVPVSVVRAGAAVDPTADPVLVAVVAVDEPTDSDWQAAEWQTVGSSHFARFAVGPTSLIGALATGRYSVWVKVIDPAETPVKRATNRIVIY